LLAAGANDYFSPKTEFNPFTHTWSLGVEEQFYIVFPIIYFLWVGKGRRLAALVLLCALAAVSMYVSHVWGNSVRAFYLIPARFWELAGGVILYMFIGKWRPWIEGCVAMLQKR
jgi:peptidoglycan/LPS O-acetylase OafA/YrhL